MGNYFLETQYDLLIVLLCFLADFPFFIMPYIITDAAASLLMLI